MNGSEIVIQMDAKSILIVLGIAGTWTALLVFGWQYNRAVDRLGEVIEPYRAVAVSIGTLVTIIGYGLILALVFGWIVALVCFGFLLVSFTASGTPMLLGDFRRHVSKTSATIETAKKEVEDA